MVATREKTSKRLDFEIIAPLAMGLSKGDSGILGVRDTEMFLKFSTCPSRYPSRQRIYLIPKEKKPDDTAPTQYDLEKRRPLTSDIDGSLRFNMQLILDKKTDIESKSTIGTLSHHPEYSKYFYQKEAYYIEIDLPETEFEQIRDAFLAGKPPTSISIWTPDVEYGVGPDGSDKVWEVWDDTPTDATIVGFSLALSTDIPRVGLGMKKTESEEEDDSAETAKLKEAVLHSREDIQLLCFGQASLASSITGLRKQINILIAVVIVIAVMVALGSKW